MPAGRGWFVLNARDAQWHRRPGKASVSFTGKSEFEAETYFPQLGVNLIVLEPGEPNAMYHWEADQEGFLHPLRRAGSDRGGRGAAGCGSGISSTAHPRRDTSSSEPATVPAGSWP